MKIPGALLWEPGTNSGWSVEEIELDGPKFREVTVKLAASGICHSDDHVDTGDIPLPWAPLLGGHEGAGVVTDLGEGADQGASGLQKGDHVGLSFLPSCGQCDMCARGRANMCALGAGVLGGVAPDGTHRVHARGQGVGCFSYLGTFAPYVTVPVDACVKIDKDIPLDKAALVGCGVPTGWGSSVYAGEIPMGGTVVIFGVGGVGMNAVQGARHKMAGNIVAVDPNPKKRDWAKDFGATHVAKDEDEALEIVTELTNGQGAHTVIITMGVADPKLMQPAQAMTMRGGTLVLTAASKMQISNLDFDLYTFAMSGKRLQGTLYGTTNARIDMPLILSMYKRGEYKLDELVTNTYKLEDINQAFTDLRNGDNIRGVIMYD